MRKKAEIIKLKKGHKATKAEEIVRCTLPKNLLNATPIVNDIGPKLLDKIGAAVLKDNVYHKVNPNLRYFGKRRNELYEVPLTDNTVCMGA